jgi:hypothetical protein
VLTGFKSAEEEEYLRQGIEQEGDRTYWSYSPASFYLSLLAERHAYKGGGSDGGSPENLGQIGGGRE